MKDGRCRFDDELGTGKANWCAMEATHNKLLIDTSDTARAPRLGG